MGSQAKKVKSYYFRLTVTLIHLAFWAELGVLTRAFLAKLFDLGCDGGWGPCLEGGIYFKDMPCNLLGSFVIGFFAASSTLGLHNDKPLAVLPQDHTWQENLELQIGIRTGYCGSLTTFASWQLELMYMAIKRNQWINMVVGFIVGLYTAIASYLVGTHTALFIDRWLLPHHEDVVREFLRYREDELEAMDGELSGEQLHDAAVGRSWAQRELEEWEPDLPTNVPSISRVSLRRRSAGLSNRPPLVGRVSRVLSSPASVGVDEDGLAGEQAGQELRVLGAAELAERGRDGALVRDAERVGYPAQVLMEEGGPNGGPARPAVPAGLEQPAKEAKSTAAAAAAAGEAAAAAEDHGGPTLIGIKIPASPAIQRVVEGAVKDAKVAAQHAAAAAQQAHRELQTFMGNKTDCAVLLGLVGLTTALAVGSGVETRHKWLRQIWIECLFGPFGCILRWWLSRYNYTLTSSWAWFPIGTYIANMLATAIDFGLESVLERRGSELGYWSSLLIPAVMTGFCGSLSTVSTFVTEVVKFAELFPETVHAYSYAAYSIVGGALLGVALYGWSVWVPL